MKLLSALLASIASVSAALAADPKAAVTTGDSREKDVTPDEAEKLIASHSGIHILDVRTPEEFAEGHLKGAKNINVFDKDFEKQVSSLDPRKPILVHCQSGRRSTEALSELRGKVKFPVIYHLTSGFKGWKEAKKPIETGAPEKK